jgi:hypothetical protein
MHGMPGILQGDGWVYGGEFMVSPPSCGGPEAGLGHISNSPPHCTPTAQTIELISYKKDIDAL